MRVIRCQPSRVRVESGSSLGLYGAGSVTVGVGAVAVDAVGVIFGDVGSVGVGASAEDSIAVGSAGVAVAFSVGQDGLGIEEVGVGDEGTVAAGVVPVGTGVGDVPVGAGDEVPVVVGVGEALLVPDGEDDVGEVGTDGEGAAVVVGVAVVVFVDVAVGDPDGAGVDVGAAVAVFAVPGVDPAAGSGSGASASSCSPLRTVWEWSAATGMAQR